MEQPAAKGDGIFMSWTGEGKHTVEEILSLPTGERAELLDGEIFRMEAPSRTHQEILMWLSYHIYDFIKKKKGPCRVIQAPFGVFLKKDDKNYVEPDISVICDLEKLDERGCHGAPDWIIEIVSPSSKAMDYYKKPEAYKSAGVGEYWIVDSAKEIVVVYDLAGEEAPVVYRFTDNITPHAFPGLALHFGEWQKKEG